MGSRRPRLVVLGGTFDRFHVGHQALLAAALAAGSSIGVGVTTARYLRSHPKPLGERVQPYSTRKAAVVRFLEGHRSGQRVYVGPLNDRWGRSVGPEASLLVISPDTRAGARSVNAERRRRGLPPVRVKVIPFVLADDLIPVSSRRIRSGAISAEGRRLRALRVGLATDRATDVGMVEAALKPWMPGVRVRIHRVGSDEASPRVRTARTAADLASTRADEAIRHAELGIGVARGSSNSRGLAVAIRDSSGEWPRPSRRVDRASNLARVVDEWVGHRARGRGATPA